MNESLKHLYSQALYVIFIVIFFHTIFALILFRYIIKPVNILISGAESLSRGQLNTRIHLPGRNDEFASLAQTFNRMAESIHSNVESLSGEITSARETIEKSEKMTIHDELTGLYNRRYFIERLEEEVKRTSLKDTVIGMMIIELDNFKEITSIYGHQTENIIIAETAKKIERALTAGEIAARYGDVMFAVLAPGRTAESMRFTAEKIIQAAGESSIITADGVFKVTVSAGITDTCGQQARNSCSSTALLESADEAIQKARDNGRNRAEIVS
jgi:diguanylate cyclase (GGDEF)-like protein